MIDDEVCGRCVSFLRSLRFFAAIPDLSFLCDFAAWREIYSSGPYRGFPTLGENS